LLDVPRPEPEAGEVLVRTLRVGVDGTDHEVIAGHHGSPPAGEDYLILGHEAVGVVAEPNGTDFEGGDVVVPTVRRPPPSGSNEYFERGEADMAPPEATVERGIDGAHGFMSEYFTSPAEYLVPLPAELTEWGFLVEPISISEKALELAYASRSSFQWEPETALVLGNGSLGLLTVAMLIDSRETPVDEIPDGYEPADLVYEATGYAKHAFESIDALAPNGVAALLGVPGSWEFEVDGGRLHKELVLENKALVGSVNSGRSHFQAAVDTLGTLPSWFFDDLVTRVVSIDSFADAFDRDDDIIKTAVEFDSP
jgi:threonine dehydrogenase-like Zn-dependent dehydrogenase